MMLRSDSILYMDLTKLPQRRMLSVDQDRLFLVLHNLTHNSISAWQQAHGQNISGLRLRWEAREIADELILSVSDNGPGIPRRIAKTAVDAWISVTPGGSGLGLYLSRRYVEMHGGRLTLGNQVEGGCVARIRQPLRSI